MGVECLPYWFVLTAVVFCGLSEAWEFPVYLANQSFDKVPTNIPENVDYLDLSLNDIQAITSTSFHRFVNLKHLAMYKSKLKYIGNGTFDNNGRLVQLLLPANQLEMLPVDFGLAQESLIYINLHGSLLNPQLLSGPYFVRFPKLRYLALGSIFFGHFDPDVVPNELYALTLSWGCLSRFPNISHLTQLGYLGMESMCMADIPLGHIASLRSVTTLHISGNRFTTLPDITFMTHLSSLKLSGNYLTSCLDLYDLPLTVLELASNPLTCDASLCWIRMSPWMKPELQIDDVTCASPEMYNGRRLMDVYPVELHCYKDVRFRHLFAMFYQKHETGMTKTWILQEDLTTGSQWNVRSKLECATICWKSSSCTGALYRESQDGVCHILV